MASKQQKLRPSSSSSLARRGREIMRPIISSDVMGNRNVEIVPVGAWVEPGTDDLQVDAVLAAQREEEKLRQMKEEKENKLRNFQKQVKQRVSQASRIKRHQQIQEAEQAFELERKVVQQSCLTADMSRRDTCLHRHDLDLAIRKRLLQKYGEDMQTWESEHSSPAFQFQSEENHQVTDKARQQLVSKKIAQNDSPYHSKGQQKTKVTHDIQIPTVRSVVDIDDFPASDNRFYGITETDHERHEADSEQFLDSDKCENMNGSSAQSEKCDEGENSLDKGTVQFCESTLIPHSKRKKRPASSKRPHSAHLSAVFSQESESDAVARQRKQQAAVSRRIFMDREREAVRENIRRQQHRKKIVSLKKEKEEYRQQLEEMSHQQLEPTASYTGESTEDILLREKMEALEVKKMVDARTDLLKRAREMERYLGALRHSLIEKVTRQGQQLPALCACGETVWDTHPETCANNCFFYRNHRAYARALQSLLSSTEVM